MEHSANSLNHCVIHDSRWTTHAGNSQVALAALYFAPIPVMNLVSMAKTLPAFQGQRH